MDEAALRNRSRIYHQLADAHALRETVGTEDYCVASQSPVSHYLLDRLSLTHIEVRAIAQWKIDNLEAELKALDQ